MMMQAQALQRGEKFKESEVRGRTHATVHTTDERVLESAQGAQHVLTVLPPPPNANPMVGPYILMLYL